MENLWRGVAVWLLGTGCGLERDYAAFLAASQSGSESDSGTGSGSGSTGAGPETGTSTGEAGEQTGSSGHEVSTGAASGESSGGSSGAAEGDGESTGSASTGVMGFCGDGVVDAELLEECDDGNTDETDRCTQTCRKIRLVFVSSRLLQGNIGGLQSADAYCKSSALKAMMADPLSRITDPGNFKALLPISTQTVFERHFHGEGPYQLVNGLRVSDSFEQLFSEPHHNPINVTEYSQSQHYPVWTGMDSDGSNFPGIDFCQDWTSTKGSATFGDADAVDGWWLFVDIAVNNPTPDCGGELPMYCLEQE